MPSSSSARALAAALLLACWAALALAPAALGKGRVDGSFGSAGFVDLDATLVPGRGLGTVEVGPDGDIFVSEETYGGCGRRFCFNGEWMKRYGANGALAQSYLQGSEVRHSTTWVRTAVDSRGRPLLAWEKQGKRVLVRRLKPSGGVDRRFGRAGTVALPCNCSLQSLATLPGGGVLVAAGREIGTISDYRGALWYIVRLLPDGTRDASFGGDGVVRLWRRGRGGAKATPGRHGTVLLASSACCGEGGPDVDLFSLLSRNGRVQPRFEAAYKRSLPAIFGASADEYWEPLQVEALAKGVRGFASGWEQARAFRLLDGGRLDRSYGRRGVTVLPLRFADSAPDGEGGTFVVGWLRNGYYVRRIDRNGAIDRSFGTLSLPDAYNDEGLGIVPQGRGRAIIVARDLHVCRQACPSSPKLFRIQR